MTRPGVRSRRGEELIDATDIEAIERRVAGLFPPFVRCAVTPVSDACPPPHPEEMHEITNAVRVRRQEFACGRACAHRALRALGAGDAPIPGDARRAPVWPPGTVGSISHSRALAGAAVARTGDARGIGLDIERDDATLDDAHGLVLTGKEIEALRMLREPGVPDAAIVVFSAKECVYKAISPATGWTLGYDDIEIALDLAGRSFTATVSPPNPGATTIAVTGRFGTLAGHVVTAVCIGAAGGMSGDQYPSAPRGASRNRGP